MTMPAVCRRLLSFWITTIGITARTIGTTMLLLVLCRSSRGWNPSPTLLRSRYRTSQRFRLRAAAGASSPSSASASSASLSSFSSTTATTKGTKTTIISGPANGAVSASDGSSTTLDSHNPALWKGSTYSSSAFVTHVIAGDDSPTVLEAVGSIFESESNDNVLDKDSNGPSSSSPSTHDTKDHGTDSERSSMPSSSSTTSTPPIDPGRIPLENDDLDPIHLLRLGSVWFLPAHAPRDPSRGGKPTRLSDADATQVLDEGDYLRIHVSPRRFPKVYHYDWTEWHPSILRTMNSDGDPSSIGTATAETTESNNETTLQGVVLARNDHFWVVDKPTNVPVHPTVDNIRENVAESTRQALIQERQRQLESGNADHDSDIYVATPQRLDQNTSGLFLLARSKTFASYFARLLRLKTSNALEKEKQEQEPEPERSDRKSNDETTRIQKGENRHAELSKADKEYGKMIAGQDKSTIKKLYKCLVCIQPPAASANSTVSSSVPWSMASAYQELQSMDIITHYLEPSIRAPKTFARKPGNETWLECHMRILNVSDPIPLFGSDMVSDRNGDDGRSSLAIDLWQYAECIPPSCIGVVELEVELLTGRTHQIRGQFAADGFPLVGDVQYGGAVPRNTSEANTTGLRQLDRHFVTSEQLALQCCALEFLDGDVVEKSDGKTVMSPSNRWNKFRLEESWWSPILHRHMTKPSTIGGATTTAMVPTSVDDLETARRMQTGGTRNEKTDSDTNDKADTETDTTLSSSSLSSESSASTGKGPDFTKVYPEERLWPPRVSLSHGKHKYVLVKAVHPLKPDKEEWFVRSASTKEAQGPYHADVAYELVEWLEALEFEVTVTGGGRIYYNYGQEEVKVYGFSYGFGMADHQKAGSLIAEHMNLNPKYDKDNSRQVY